MGIPGITTLLLADEYALVREGLSQLCAPDQGFRVIAECADGQAALFAIRSDHPDIAILDLQLPKLHCLEVIRKCRQENLPVRFIVLGGRPERKLALEVLRAGANAFVLKSSPSSQLHQALQTVVAGSVFVAPEIEFEKMLLGPSLRCSDPVERLSSREYQVFRLLVDGIRAKEIAARLELSPKTVDTYRASLMRKLDIHDVAGLVKYAIHRDMLTT